MKKFLPIITLTLFCSLLVNAKNAPTQPQNGKATKKIKVTVTPLHKKARSSRHSKASHNNKRIRTRREAMPDRRSTRTETWDFLQFGVWFNTPKATQYSNVYGIKIGAPICSGYGTVKGIETAVFCGATDNITGLQACIITSCSKHLTGLQFSIINYANVVDGVQLGILNIATKQSFQIGILNHIEGAAIPWLPVFNWKF